MNRACYNLPETHIYETMFKYILSKCIKNIIKGINMLRAVVESYCVDLSSLYELDISPFSSVIPEPTNPLTGYICRELCRRSFLKAGMHCEIRPQMFSELTANYMDRIQDRIDKYLWSSGITQFNTYPASGAGIVTVEQITPIGGTTVLVGIKRKVQSDIIEPNMESRWTHT